MTKSDSDGLCPCHPISIPDDREVCCTDEKKYEWRQDAAGYFLVKVEDGNICCGWVSADHEMVWELRGKDPHLMVREIVERDVCSSGNLAYIAQELMLAKSCLDSGEKYVQR